MVLARTSAWDDHEDFVTDPQIAAAILRDGATFDVCSIEEYLDLLEQRTGERLDALRLMSANALMFQNGDEHLGRRRLVSAFFAPKALTGWFPAAERAVADALERVEQAAEPDLIRDLVRPSYWHFITRVIGIEGDDALLASVEQANRVSHPMLSLSEIRRIDAACAHIGRALAAEVPPRADDPPSLKSFLLAEGADRFSPESLRAVAQSVLIGSPTVAQMFGIALHGLLRQDKAVWRDVASPAWSEHGLERILSLYPSSLTMIRAPSRDGDLGGCPYRAEQPVVVDVAGANARLRHAGRDRPGARFGLLSFGAGAHKCPGEGLSRLFLGHALPAAARRLPDLALHHDKVDYHVSPMVQIPLALPCERDGASRRVSARMVEINDFATARQIVGDAQNFAPPTMEPHLRSLAERTDIGLDHAILVARNAMFFMSGERHAVIRRAVADQLGGNRLPRWQPAIDSAITAALDRLAASARPDLITDFADPVFHGSMRAILGIEPADVDEFDRLAPVLQDVLEPWLPIRELQRLEEVIAGLLGGLDVPGDASPRPLLTALADTDLPGFDLLDKKALTLVLYGASFNVAHTLGNMLHWLLGQPEEERLLAADPDWLDRHFEPLLARCASPKYIYRMARRAVTAGGMAFAANDTARLQLLMINRNDAGDSLPFGHGLHRCVGAAVSRRLLKAAIPLLLRRFPNIRLVRHQQRYHPMSQTIALASLPCVVA